MTSAVNMFHAKCAVSSTCSFSGQKNLTFNGTTRSAWYGWPIESSRSNVWWSIDQLITHSSDFVYTHPVTGGHSWAFFDRADAPTPSACRVTYLYYDADKLPDIQIISSGC